MKKSEQKPKIQAFFIQKTNTTNIIPQDVKIYLRFSAVFDIVRKEIESGRRMFYARIEKNGTSYKERYGNES